MEEPLIHVVLVNYNGYEDTIECINSLQYGSYVNYKIVIVDNGSTDHSIEKLSHLSGNVFLIKSSENLGFAGGNNLGVKYALDHEAEFIVLLNNDTVVGKYFLIEMVSKMLVNNIEILTCKIAYFSNNHLGKYWYAGGEIDWRRGFVKHYTDDTLTNELNKVTFMSGCCIFAHKDIFKKHLLPEYYFMYFEDMDYCLTLAKAGYRLYYTPDIEIKHKVSASVGIESEFFVKYWNRNRLIILKKYRRDLGYRYYLLLARFYITRFIKGNLYLIFGKKGSYHSMLQGISEGRRYKVYGE